MSRGLIVSSRSFFIELFIITRNINIIFLGHKLLFELRQRIIQTELKDKSSYEAMLEALGQILHLLQSFYSNTNWIEMGKQHIMEELGNCFMSKYF